MNNEERSDLEQQLIREPFNMALRAQYAELLATLGETAASLEQWRIILQQQPAEADPYLQAASCCQRLDDEDGVKELLHKARQCPDFDPDDSRLVDLESEAPRQALRLISGGRDSDPDLAEVRSIGSTDKVRFCDVVGMKELKKTIRMRIVEPFLKPGLFERFRKRTGGGVLLYGPPGCGKTMIARAIASECEALFTAVGIADVLNLWVGQSERNLAAIFEQARQEAPSVLFFDELDALAYARGKASSDYTRTLVNEFLNQLDGMSGRNDRVLILGATNMPWDVDDAMKRPGRFDRQVFVPPPDRVARAEMFSVKLADVPTEPFDAQTLGERSRHFSGADIDGVIEQAKDIVLDEIMTTGSERGIREEDLARAIDEADPSTLEWLKTARNLVKFGGGGRAYREVERYLRSAGLY
jgi:SpoVK/Ycf46/Vps4 family AAA+-type ATPase